LPAYIEQRDRKFGKRILITHFDITSSQRDFPAPPPPPKVVKYILLLMQHKKLHSKRNKCFNMVKIFLSTDTIKTDITECVCVCVFYLTMLSMLTLCSVSRRCRRVWSNGGMILTGEN